MTLESKARLLEAISPYVWPHCSGCDEWGCPHKDDDKEKLLDDIIKAIDQAVVVE